MNRLLTHPQVISVAVTLGLLAPVGTARAQFEDLPVAAPREGRITIDDGTFNQWAYGMGTTPESLHLKLGTRLKLRIEQIDGTCHLTEAQKSRLRLAGQGDIKRLHDRLEEQRRAVVNVPVERSRLNEVLRSIQALQASMRSDPFDDDSIFGKVLRATLDAEQTTLYQHDAAERKRFQHQESVNMTVALFDRVAGLGGDQRRQFAALLLENTQPPRRPGVYDYYVILLQVPRIPEDTLRPLFSPEQWNALNKQIERARTMEPVLKEGNYLPDEPAVTVSK